MKCDYFEALHIEMHVNNSNLNTAPNLKFELEFSMTRNCYLDETNPKRWRYETWQESQFA